MIPTNKRVVATRPGGPEQLQVQEEPLPEPQPTEVRVRVLAAGVAYGDVMLRQGKTPGGPPFPLTPGYDLMGEVEAVGSAVTAFRPGDRVAALPGSGSYITYRCLPARDLVPVPAHLPPAEVVSVLLNYTTAYQLLTRAASLRAGQRVLSHGAAGAWAPPCYSWAGCWASPCTARPRRVSRRSSGKPAAFPSTIRGLISWPKSSG